MPINPLQLPTWAPVPQVDFSPLMKIGEEIGAERQRQRVAGAMAGLVDSVPEQGAPLSQLGAPRPTQAESGAGQQPRGIRNNNPGNIKDGPFAKTLPGYKGSDGTFAVFESPDHGMNAMDALLTSYGRRGAKTARDIVGRWAPATDGNNVDEYASFVGDGNPDLPIDLNDEKQRRFVATRMAQFENGRPAPQSASATQPEAVHNRGMPAGMKERIRTLLATGDPRAEQVAMALITKYLPKEPMKLGEGDILVDPDSGRTLVSAPGKPQAVRPGGALVQNGRVVYQAPSPEDQKPTIVGPGSTAINRSGNPIYTAPDRAQTVAPGGTLVRNGQPIYTAPDRDSAPQKLADLAAERESQVVNSGLDPNDARYRAYILTGKLPNEDKMPVTPTDKKAILEADEHVLAHNQVIANLNDLKAMSKKAWGYPGSGTAAKYLSPFSQDAQNTYELNTTATTNALAQLKSIFGGAPTEGERKILLDIQGSSTMPDALRQKVYDRAIKAAEARRELAQRQADSIRDRTYWQPGGGMSTPPAATMTREKVEGARSNPEAALAEARAAIAAGADRAQVVRRLQQLRIDPRGL